MNNVTVIGLDIGKRVFQVHGVDRDGKVALQKKLRREEMRRFFSALPSCRVPSRRARQRTTGPAS